MNDRACTLTGYTREELLGRSVSDINPDYPQPIWDQWADAARGPGAAVRRRATAAATAA